MKIRFVAIGGSVMHQLAIALRNKGYKISGSDDEIFEPALSQLKHAGILPQKTGWYPEEIDQSLDTVILGMHAKADNPELIKAQELGITVYSFPAYIYQESKTKTRVVVGGSHGKTTTTAMIMHVLKEAQKDFDYLVGARLEGFPQSVNISDAPVIICEGDEYPASAIERLPKFHFLFPHIAVLTGIAWDHINIFPTFENYLDQFRIFINKIEAGGHLIYNESDEVLRQLVDEVDRKDIIYHPYQVPEHEINKGQTTLKIGSQKVQLKVFGNHNLMNLQAARLVCALLDIQDEQFAKAISSFKGAAKRLELLASSDRTIFYRDFAHAPSKVKATIDAVKSQYSQKKIIIVLELHTFSSLNSDFMGEYAGSVDNADEAVVYFSKHALELKRLPELPRDVVKNGFGKNGLNVFNERAELEEWLHSQNLENAVVVFMSSGNYDGIDIESFAFKNTQSTS